MPTVQDVQGWQGRTLVDADGDKIGKIEDIYLDRQSGEPEWVAVKTGLFGTRVSFVPIRDATATGDEVRVAHPKDKVKDAPNIEADGELSPDEERVLYEHYGREDYGDWTDESEDRSQPVMGLESRGEDRSTGEAGTAAAGTAGPAGTTAAGGTESAEAGTARTADEGTAGPGTTVPTGTGTTGTAGTGTTGAAAGQAGDEAMTRSEEELVVGTQRRETGRARLRKYVVTEDVKETVPVQREELRVEREPITDDNIEQATQGPDISEAEHEITLHAEEPVAEKHTVPKERVRLDKDVHTDEQTVSDEVRKERIEPEGDVRDRP